MRRYGLVAGIVVGIVLATSPPAAALAPRTPGAAGPLGARDSSAPVLQAAAPTQSCTQQLKSLRTTVTGGHTDGACLWREAAKLTADQQARLSKLPAGSGVESTRARSAAAGGDDIVQQCSRQSTLTWFMDRFKACRTMRLWVEFRDMRTQQLTGRLSFIERNVVVINAASWYYDINLLQETSWGNVAGTVAQGSFDCAGSCQIYGSDFPPQSAVSGEIHGVGSFGHNLPGILARGTAFSKVTYNFSRPNTINTNGPIRVEPPQIRCDSQIWDWFSWSYGCVFPDVSPVFGMNSNLYPSVTRHVREAQNSGIPGRDFPLTRMRDDDRQAANRDRACPPWLTRPEGYTCDEYPFASTLEGAADPRGTDHGRTFWFCEIPDYPQGVTGVGWSACMVPEKENLYAGIDLGEFYITQRILDGDEFRVEID